MRLITNASHVQSALVLIAGGDEWLSRALESVLQPAGHRVLRVFTALDAQERARTTRPDVVLLAGHLPDRDGASLCRELRQDPAVGPAVPILAVATGPASREQRVTWLRAGARDCLTFPLDQEELVLKLGGMLEVRREIAAAREAALVDQATGLYTAHGLERRARELVAEALRLHAALACVVFGLEPPPARSGLAEVLRSHGRQSDTIGWWNGGDLAILAPATDADGAAQLAHRMARAIATAPSAPDVRAGYVAVADAHATPVEPEALLVRASAALALARRGEGGEGIRRFEPGP